MRILGIDPGSRFTGYAIVDDDGSGFKVIDFGVVKIKPIAFSYRLLQIYAELTEIIQTQAPDTMAIEQVFVAKNPSAALKLGHARGAVLLAGASAGLHAEEYSALQIKKAVVGQGRADKSQVQAMVMRLLNLQKLPATDAADALAVALCHGQSQRFASRQSQILLQSSEPVATNAAQEQLRFRRGRLRRR